MTNETESITYKKASKAVDQWLELHKGETFDLDLISRQMGVKDPAERNLVSIKLAHEVKKGNLTKNNRLYRYIDTSVSYINWVDAKSDDILDIHFPYGIEDKSHFSFEESVLISPGDLIVIAGTSNMGKTLLCLNFLWENMDKYPCTLMGNEYSPSKFKRRISHMDWADPIGGDGKPKFELIERYDAWQDIIRPDNINIIDWIGLGDNFYQIGSILQGIKSKLRGGIALCSIQKNAGKSLGMGGDFGQHLASLYMTIDFEKLTVIKAKEWDRFNPNGKTYGFKIGNSGTMLSYIREIRKCTRCYGSGKVKGDDCGVCGGTGFIDKEGS